MKKSTIALSATLALVVAGYLGWLAWNAGQNLVTLDVRNADVLEVVHKLESQTRETILTDSNLNGKVTFKVKRAPLDTVLNIINDQVSSRWSAYYPLYTGSKSLDLFKQGLRGDVDPAVNGWTNLQSRSFSGGGFGGGRGGGGFGPPGGDGYREATQRVTLTIEGKDAQFAALALNRYAQARVIPEDGTTTLVMLKFDKLKVPDAVAKLAQQARRSWAKVYFIQGSPDFSRGRGEFSRRDRPPGDEGGRRGGPDWANMTDEEREQRRLERDAAEKELAQTLPSEQQTKIAEQQQQRDQMRQEFSSMTDDQRRARFEEMRASGGGPGGGRFGGGNRDQQRMERIKNTTPEQKVERYRTMIEQRARWEQRRQQGGGR